MKRLLASFLRDESGSTALEYALIASCLSIVIYTAVAGLGTNIKAMFDAAAAGFN